jgi:hypothetical protein
MSAVAGRNWTPPAAIWLGEERLQLLLRSVSEPDLYRLVTSTDHGQECTCRGFPRSRWKSCVHTLTFLGLDVDEAPLLTVRTPVLLSPRQGLLPSRSEPDIWRLVTRETSGLMTCQCPDWRTQALYLCPDIQRFVELSIAATWGLAST